MTKDSKQNKQKTCIEDLPNELLSRILACISLKHDLDNVQRVSKLWYAVVDETIGREIAITSLTSFNGIAERNFLCIPHAHLGCLGLDMISNLGVKTCYVDLISCGDDEVDENDNTQLEGDNEKEQWDDSCSSEAQPQNSIHSFKYPHLLQQLYFTGSIRSDIFNNLLKGTENLAMLQVNLLAVSQLSPSDLANLRLPQLKALGVGKCLKASGKNFDDALGLPNLQILLEENRFANLGQLDLRFPVTNFKDFRTLQALLKFLTVHTVLKELYVIMEFPVQVNILRGFQEELGELASYARRHTNCGSLRICEIQGIRLHASYPQLLIWQAFLEQQKSLRSLTLRLGHLSSHFLAEVCSRNKGSLEHLFLYKLNETMDSDSDNHHETVLDCRVFNVASRLQTLYALGCDLVSNVKALPCSLSTVFFSGAISSPEIEHILLELPELQFVSLKNARCGKQDGFGVNLNLLHRFIEARKVRRLILNGSSLTEDYPAEGICNGDPKNPSQLMEFDNWDSDHMYLDWELNKDMYYVDKCY